MRVFPGGPVAKTFAPNAGGPGSTPGQRITSHMPQLKIFHATMKTQHNQINKYFLKKERYGTTGLSWLFHWHVCSMTLCLWTIPD